jgi:glucosyl-dolichyl phosphate glucuronosyltransferase
LRIGAEATTTAEDVSIDVVICTYNRAANLDEVLSALSRQSADGVNWSVLVVDNASTDPTAEIVEAHRSRRVLPGLRRVMEQQQGLTFARGRGVRETRAPWIAFVDDDNLLERGWLTAIARAIRSHPDAGGVGGRVVLDWEKPPPGFVTEFGFCFAEQELGTESCEAGSLVGAGMVVSRAALDKCGWIDRPLLADRVGNRLASGGDVEIAQRIRAAGYRLWFTPEAVLHHRIPSSRANWQYLLRVSYGLGGGAALMSALVWRDDWRSWHRAARQQAFKGFVHALLRYRRLIPILAWLSFAIGFARGVRTCAAVAPDERQALLGAAARKKDMIQQP